MDRLDMLTRIAKGQWEAAVFLTYGFDVVTFERVIWPLVSDTCRMGLVLCDGDHYGQLSGGLGAGVHGIRHLNIRYACGGVQSQFSFHPKAVLLLKRGAARLLVGSGNISMQGYASGGELFTEYNWTQAAAEVASLQPFLAVKHLIDGLFESGLAPSFLRGHAQGIWDAFPWLLTGEDDNLAASQVVHNSSRPLLDQLSTTLGGEAVEELHILSPFYDARCEALQRVIGIAQPAKAFIYLQEGRTSVNTEKLKGVGKHGQAVVRFVPCHSSADRRAYLHAKAYLLRTSTRDICLSGSPNCSIAALSMTSLAGNTELASLSTGRRGEWEGLFDGLVVSPAIDSPAELNLVEPEPLERERGESRPRLTGCAYESGEIMLEFDKPARDFVLMEIRIGNAALEAEIQSDGERGLRLRVCSGTLLLDRPALLTLVFTVADSPPETQSLFVCNLGSLRALSRRSTAVPREAFESLGDLLISDREAYTLLTGWLGELLVDARSLKELTGRPVKSDVFDDTEVEIDWRDIDFESLREHPRVRQYLTSRGPSSIDSDSPVQVMLIEVQRAFLGLARLEPLAHTVSDTSLPEWESEAETEEEAAQREAVAIEAERRQKKAIQDSAVRFMRRCIRGFESEAFCSEVGPAIIGKNYVLFQHFINLCFRRAWVEQNIIAKVCVRLLRSIWGDTQVDGWFGKLDDESKRQFVELVQSQYTDAECIALVLKCYDVAADANSHDGEHQLKTDLQSVWRRILSDVPFEINEELLDYAWVYAADFVSAGAGRDPHAMVSELHGLAERAAEDELLRQMRIAAGSGTSVLTETVKVKRPVGNTRAERLETALVLERTTEWSDISAVASRVLCEWLRLESRRYYRLEFRRVGDEANHAVAVYMPGGPDRFLFIPSMNGETTDIPVLKPAARPWDPGVESLICVKPAFDLNQRGPRAVYTSA